MLDIFRARGSGYPSEKNDPRPDRLAMALEERVLFDASAVAAVAQVLDQPQPDAPDVPPSADADSATCHDSHDVAEALKSHAVPGMLEDAADPGTEEPGTALLVVDTSIADWQNLVRDADPAAELVLVNDGDDGITSISTALEGRDDISEIHILSHGEPGRVFLGTAALDADTVTQRSGEIAGWSGALTAGADVLIYSCSAGAGDAGTELVGSLANLTGADVAASDDDTGSTNRGGDWDLEVQNGDIEAGLPLSAQAVDGYHGLLNDAPDVTATGSALAYTEGSGAVALDSGLTLTDADGNIAQVTIQLTSNYDSGNDVLAFTNTPNITGAWDAGTGTLTLSGQDTPENYQAALRTVTFANGSDDPSATTRTVTFTVTDVNPDGDPDGPQTDTATRDITFTAVDDAPTVAAPISDVTVAEDAANTTIDLSGVFTDVDSDDLSITKAVFSNDNTGLVDATISGNTLTLDYQDNVSGTATVTIQGTSGGKTVNDTFTVTVNSVNDAPVSTSTADFASITEDPATNTGVLVSDFLAGHANDTLDANTDLGLAVTGVDTSGVSGTWQHSTNRTDWNDFPADLAGNAVLLLAHDAYIRFVPNADQNGSATLNYRVWDEGSGATGDRTDASTNGGTTQFSSGEVTSSLTVTAENDAPVLTAGTTLSTINEDTPAATNAGDTVASLYQKLVDGSSVSDVDSGASTGIAVTGADNANGTWQYSTDGGSIWQSIGTRADGNALLLATSAQNMVRFLPDDNYYGTADLTVRAWDQTSGSSGSTVNIAASGTTTAFSSDTAALSITVSPVNDAPVSAEAADFPAITEDPATNTGTLVSDLLTGHAQDTVDANTNLGLAVTSADTTIVNGTWQYSSNRTDWNDFPADLAGNNALLLTHDTYVRFVPDTHENGTTTLTYRVWDESTGALGDRTDASSGGDTSTFSSNQETATLAVTPVNDTPEVVNNSKTIAEDHTSAQATLITTADLQYADPSNDQEQSPDQLVYRLSSDLPDHGRVERKISGQWVELGANSIFSQEDVDNNLIRYVYTGGELTANSSDSFAFMLRDGAGGEVAGTFTVTIQEANDAVALTDTDVTVLEYINPGDTSTVNIGVSDGDATTADITFTIASVDALSYGVLQYSSNGTDWANATAGTSFTKAELNLGRLRYVHDGTEPVGAASSTTFTVNVTDGRDSTLSDKTVTLNISGRNDTPVLTNNGLTVDEDGTKAIRSDTVGDGTLELKATDVDSATAQITYTITDDVDNGWLSLSGVRLGVGSTFQQLDIDAGNLTYTHDGLDQRTDSFNFALRDGDGASLTDTFDITIAEVNDAPEITRNNGMWLQTTTSKTLTTSMITGTDEESTTAEMSYTWGALPASVTIEISGNPVTSFTQAQLEAGAVSIHHSGVAGDTGDQTVNFTLNDNETDITPNNLTDTAAFTLHLYETAGPGVVNHTPTIEVNEPIAVLEDNSGGVTPNTITSDHLRAYDHEDPATALVYTVTNIDNINGGLYRDGVLLGVNGTFTQDDINNDLITYDHDGSETTAASFTFALSDGRDSDGNVDTSADRTGTFNIVVTPVNDPPVIQTNAAVAVEEQDTDVTDDGNALTLNDQTNVTLITLDAIGGTNRNLNWSDSDNTDTSQLVFNLTDTPDGGTLRKWDGDSWETLSTGGRFSVADVTNGLVAYFHDPDSEAATDAFSVELTDGGSTPSNTVAVQVNVTPVNDAPTARGGTFSVNEGASQTLNAVATHMSATDSDDVDANLDMTLATLPTHGKLILNGTEITDANKATQTFRAADLTAGKLIYTHDGSENFEDSYTFTAADDDLASSSPATVNITVKPQNDDPTIIVNQRSSVNEGGTLTIQTGTVDNTTGDGSNLKAFDPDNTADQVQFRITDNVDHGYLFLDANGNNTLDAGEKQLAEGSAFTLDDLDNNRLVYQHDGTEPTVAPTDQFDFTVSDSGGGTEPSDTFIIDVTATNDAPEISAPTGALVNEDSSVSITGITVADVDVTQGTGELQLTLSVGTGTLTVTPGATGIVPTNNGSGTVTIQGTPANINTLLANGVTYTPSGDHNSLRGGDTLALSLSDLGNSGLGGVQTVTSNVPITINPINDAPEMTYSGSDFDGQTVNETATEDVAEKMETIVVSDLDIDFPETSGDDNGRVQVTLSVDQGTLTLDDTTGLTFTTGDGTADATMTFSGAIADVNAALAKTGSTGLLFTGPLNFNDTATISVTANDLGNEGAGGPLTTTGTIKVVVAADNDAPVLDDSTNLTIAAVNEDVTDGANTGTTVADILGSTVSDVDAGAVEGMAIVGVTNTNGTWQYNTGSGWTNVPTDAADTKAVLLNVDDTVRFVPAQHYNGTDTGSLSIRAWDTTQGSAGPNHNIAGTGTTTAFSTATDTVSVTVNAVNDAPVISDMGGTVTFTEGEGGGTAGTPVILDSDATIADLDIDDTHTDATDDDYNGATITVRRQGGAVTTDAFDVSTAGAVSKSGSDLIVGGTTVATITTQSGGSMVITFNADASAAAVDTVLQNVTYNSTADNVSGTITVETVFDDGNASQNVGAQGSGGALTDSATVTVNVITSQDAPVLTAGGTLTSVVEDVTDGANAGTTVADILGSSTGSDPDGGGLTGLAVTAVDNTNGTWQYTTNSGTAWTAIDLSGGPLHLTNAATNSIRFVPSGDFNGTATITHRAWDQTNAVVNGDNAAIGATGGTTAYSDGNHASTVTVSTVNDAPVLTNNHATVDAGGSTENTPVTIGSVGSPALVVYDLDLDAGHANQNTGGDPDVQMTLQASKGTITLTTTTGLVFADSTGNGQNRVVIQGTRAELNAALATFQLNPGDDPETTATITATLSDMGNVGAGGPLTDASTITINNILPVNDAPVLTAPGSATVNEDAALDLGTQIQIADADVRANDVAVTLSIPGGSGTLALSTTDGLAGDTDGSDGTLSFSGTLAKVNAALTNLIYTPTANLNEVSQGGVVNLSVGVSDQGYGLAGAQGGAQTDSAIVPITVRTINDAPTVNGLAGDTANYEEDSAWVTLGTATSISDIEITQNEISNFNSGSLTVSISSGGLTGDKLGVTDNGPVTVSGNQISHSGQVIATFNTDADNTTPLTITFNSNTVTPAKANDVINAVAYRSTSDDPSNAGANSTRTLTWTFNDGDGTDRGGDPTSTPVNTSLTFTLINDAPVASGDKALTIDEDTPGAGQTVSALFSGSFTDADSDSLAGVAIVGNTANATTQGTWQYHDGTSWKSVGTVSETGALLVEAGDKLRFSPVQNYNGTPPGLTLRLVDDSGGALSSGSSVNLTTTGTGGTTVYSTDTVALSMTVNAINDQPSFSGLDANPTFVEDGSPVVLDADATIVDVDIDRSEDNYDGATLTIARNGGADAQDVLNATGTVGTLTEGGNLVVSGTTVGTVTTNSGGRLVLTFNSSATGAHVDTVLQSITYANTANIPPANVNLDVTFSDGNAAVNVGDQGSGGELSTTGSITVNITPVNDPPELDAPGTRQNATRGTPFEFSAANGNAISVSGDPDLGSGNVTVRVSVPQGTLTLGGTTAVVGDTDGSDGLVEITGTRAAVNAALDGLRYTDDGSEGDVTMTVRVSDNGNTGVDPGTLGRSHSGSLTDEIDTETVAIRVNDPVDDPPVVTMPTEQGTHQNNNLVFTDANRISVADPDAFEGEIDVTVSVDQGTLTLGSTTGISFPTGDTATGASVTFRGTLAEVNQALNGLTYSPTSGYLGDATITVHADDRGNTGAGGPLTDTETVLVRVTPAPVTTPPATDPPTPEPPDSSPEPEPEPPAPAPPVSPVPPAPTPGLLPTVPGMGGGGNGGGEGDGDGDSGSFLNPASLANQSLSGSFAGGYGTGQGLLQQSVFTMELANQMLRADEPTEFSIPPSAIRHNDPSAEVEVEATMPDGSPLPEWVVFNARERSFTVAPPAEHPDLVEIQITARDEQGNEATSTFIIELLDSQDQSALEEDEGENAAAPETLETLDNLHTEGQRSLDPNDPDALLPTGKPGLAEQAALAGRAGLLHQADELARLFANG